MSIRKLSPYKIIIARVTLLYYLLFLLWRWYCHLLPFQLSGPALARMHYDLSFWLMKLSGLDRLFVYNSIGSFIFSASVILLCFLSVILPRLKPLLIAFTLSYFILALITNMYLLHSAHYLGGMVWLSIALWPKKDEKFELMWDAMRYYVCWIYGSAFLWKVINGSFFQWDAGVLTAKMNLAQYLYQNPATVWANIYYYFIQHQIVLNIGHKLVALAEGLFLIGFFTRKYDWLLVILLLFIFISIYFFSDVFFAELLVVIFPLLSGNSWAWLSLKMPVLNRAL